MSSRCLLATSTASPAASSSAASAAAFFITSSMAPVAEWTPESASLTDRSVAIIGTMSIFVRVRRSSSASTFIGSAMATKSLFPKTAMGTSL